MNGTTYITVAERLDALIALWRPMWLKAIEDFLRPKEPA